MALCKLLPRLPNFTLHEGREHKTTFFFSLFLILQKIRQHLTTWTRWNNGDEVWNGLNSLFKPFSLPSPFSLLKLSKNAQYFLCDSIVITLKVSVISFLLPYISKSDIYDTRWVNVANFGAFYSSKFAHILPVDFPFPKGRSTHGMSISHKHNITIKLPQSSQFVSKNKLAYMRMTNQKWLNLFARVCSKWLPQLCDQCVIYLTELLPVFFSRLIYKPQVIFQNFKVSESFFQC